MHTKTMYTQPQDIEFSRNIGKKVRTRPRNLVNRSTKRESRSRAGAAGCWSAPRRAYFLPAACGLGARGRDSISGIPRRATPRTLPSFGVKCPSSRARFGPPDIKGETRSRDAARAFRSRPSPAARAADFSVSAPRKFHWCALGVWISRGGGFYVAGFQDGNVAFVSRFMKNLQRKRRNLVARSTLLQKDRHALNWSQ